MDTGEATAVRESPPEMTSVRMDLRPQDLGRRTLHQRRLRPSERCHGNRHGSEHDALAPEARPPSAQPVDAPHRGRDGVRGPHSGQGRK